jgi:uncharacterized protein (TIGR00251 family)
MECKIDIIVTPKSSKSAIAVEERGIKVYLHSPPADGKANEECIALFSKRLNIPKSMISIERGETGRKKTLLLKGISLEEAMKKIKGV